MKVSSARHDLLGFLDSDVTGEDEAHSVLFEGLHAVELALGDDVLKGAGLLGIEDGLAQTRRGDRGFHDDDPIRTVGRQHQVLAEHSLQRLGDGSPRLPLLAEREYVDGTVHGIDNRARVERGKHEVTGLGRLQRGAHRVDVPDLADEDHVGVLAHARPQGTGELQRVGVQLALADRGHLVVVEELDRILNGEDVAAALGVDRIDHRCERGGLARAGWAADEDEAVR